MAGTVDLTPDQVKAGAKDVDAAKDAATYDFDLAIIGGGSGGLAASKRAADHGAKVVLFDYVSPSPAGTKWGLGGTCVNVGCIPKKLMHTSALIGETMKHSAVEYGWTGADNVACDWSTLSNNVTMYIRSLNWGYKTELNKRGVQYINGKAKFLDAHTIEGTLPDGSTKKVTARRVMVATGGRPTVLKCPGAELAITSDDIFRLGQDPGKTLVVGASYVALECAGFLHGIGRETAVMVRSIPLRGFDQDMATKIVEHMETAGTKFIRGAVPEKIEQAADGKKTVFWKEGDTLKSEVYDTVLMAIGRSPELAALDLAKAGDVKLAANGKVVVDKFDRTTVPHVYAIGDIVDGGLELTPVAIAAGRHLADRLFKNGGTVMDYRAVPTTVFTPLEYGCVGLSEEDAASKFGVIEVYHTYFTPLEWQVPHLGENVCYMKLIVNPFQKEKVLGFHVLAPNAGEMTQAVAVAIRMGATKADFDSTIGIHPIVAEEVVGLTVTKSSGADAKKTGC